MVFPHYVFSYAWLHYYVEKMSDYRYHNEMAFHPSGFYDVQLVQRLARRIYCNTNICMVAPQNGYVCGFSVHLNEHTWKYYQHFMSMKVKISKVKTRRKCIITYHIQSIHEYDSYGFPQILHTYFVVESGLLTFEQEKTGCLKPLLFLIGL